MAELRRHGVTIYDSGVDHTEVLARAQQVGDSADAITLAAESDDSADSVGEHHHHAGDIIYTSRILYKEGMAFLRGEKSAREAVIDTTVNGALGASGIRSSLIMGGAQLGGAIIPVPILGEAIGALVTKHVVSFAVDAMTDAWKYGGIKKLLDQVGSEVQTALTLPVQRRQVQEILANRVFSKQELLAELERERKTAQRYEAELRVYASRAEYKPPTEAGTLSRLCVQRLRIAVLHIDLIVMDVIGDLVSQAAKDKTARCRLGEMALCLPEIFGSAISNLPVRGEEYRRLFSQAPNHPYRLRVMEGNKEQYLDTDRYFYGLCANQRERTAQPWIPSLTFAASSSRHYAAGAMLILAAVAFHERIPLWHWAVNLHPDNADQPEFSARSQEQQAWEAELQDFAKLSPAEHLAAAKAALQGSNRKRTRAGSHFLPPALALAVQHLEAIPSTAPEAVQSRTMLAELQARRRRSGVSHLPAQTALATSSAETLSAEPTQAAPLVFETHQKPAEPVDELERARSLLRSGNYREALRLFRELVAARGSDPELHASLGECELAEGRNHAALQHFNDALALSSSYGRAIIGIADTYLSEGDRAHALEWYKNYLEDVQGGPATSRAREALSKLNEESRSAGAAVPGALPNSGAIRSAE